MKHKRPLDLKIGMALVGGFVFWAFVWAVYSLLVKGSPTSPYFPEIRMENELLRPIVSSYFLGTDLYGRSVFESLSAGIAYSLGTSFLVSFCSASLGTLVGYLSARGHHVIGLIGQFSTNLIFIFPSILLAIVVMSVTGSSFWGLVFTLVFTGWAPYSRVVRGESNRVLVLPYVEGARAVGMGETRLFFTVVLPAIFPQILVHFVLGLSGVIVSESALGFLGLGGSEWSWGAMLSSAKDVLLEAPHLSIILGGVLGTLIIGLNLLGDGLRDALDPHQ